MIIKLAIKELIVKWKWSLIFICNLAFGFIGFTTVLSFQNAIEQNAKANSKQIFRLAHVKRYRIQRLQKPKNI
jgi:hypothetical protein